MMSSMARESAEHVLAIERCDEGAVQLADQNPADFIGIFFVLAHGISGPGAVGSEIDNHDAAAW